jgi:hypothetical protein
MFICPKNDDAGKGCKPVTELKLWNFPGIQLRVIPCTILSFTLYIEAEI